MRGIPIQELPTPKEAVDAKIRSNPSFSEWEAGTAAGLDMWKWENTQFYPRAFKAKVMAWYQARNRVKLEAEVAAQRAAKKKSRRR